MLCSNFEVNKYLCCRLYYTNCAILTFIFVQNHFCFFFNWIVFQTLKRVLSIDAHTCACASFLLFWPVNKYSILDFRGMAMAIVLHVTIWFGWNADGSMNTSSWFFYVLCTHYKTISKKKNAFEWMAMPCLEFF